MEFLCGVLWRSLYKARIDHGVPAQVLWRSLYKAIIAHGVSV